MGLFGDILGGVGDIAGLFSSGGADDAAKRYYQKLIDEAGGVNPTIDAQQAAPSDQGAQLDALHELQGTYRSGGLDPISRSMLAEAQSGANRNAQANREAVLEGARARGAGRSGVALALQQKGGQDSMFDANKAATDAAAVSQGNRRSAITEAAATGGRMAAAQDAINRFNASMRMGAQEGTYANKMGNIQTRSDLYSGVYNPSLHGEQRTQRLLGGIGRAVGSVGDAAMMGAGGVGASGAGVDAAWRNINDAGGLPGYGTGI